MKKGKLILICLVLLLGCLQPAQAGSNYDFFRSMEGQITFTFPFAPDVYREPDLIQLPQGWENAYIGWQNKLQLIGFTQDDTEYQVHIADLTPLFQRMQAEIPDADLANMQANGLINTAVLYISLFDGQLTAQPQFFSTRLEDKDFTICTFQYAYPDAEGVVFKGKGIMDEAKLVILMGQESPTLDELLEQLDIVESSQAAAFHSRAGETHTLGNMTLDFPNPPSIVDDTDTRLLSLFTPSYQYFHVGYRAMDLSSGLGSLSVDEVLEQAAQLMANAYLRDGRIEEYTIEKAAEGVYCLDGLAAAPLTDTEYRQRYVDYYALDGYYSIIVPDSPEAQALIDSVRFGTPAPAQ